MLMNLQTFRASNFSVQLQSCHSQQRWQIFPRTSVTGCLLDYKPKQPNLSGLFPKPHENKEFTL